jgi:L-seryl-tRNA(Ser) seleniumtransferase
MLLRQLVDIKRQAKRCADMLKRQFSSKLDVSLNPAVSEIGGGALSTEELPTFVVTIRPKTMKVEDLARALRRYRIPIFGRVSADSLLLDFRTVLKDEEKIIVEAFKAI